MNCAVQPGNIGMLRAVGTMFLIALVVALFTGKAYFRGVVTREDDPWGYWSTVASYAVLGIFLLGGTLVCAVASGA